MKPVVSEVFHIRRLLIAFVAVVVLFVGSTLYTAFDARDIDAEAESIAANALPSIHRLAAIRTALRHLGIACDRYTTGSEIERRLRRSQIDHERRLIDEELTAYLKQPFFEGEMAVYDQIPPALRTLDESLRKLVAEVEAHDLQAASKTVDDDLQAAIETTDDAVFRLSDFNANGGAHNVARIAAIRRRTTRIAFVLDAVSVLLAIAAAVVTVRAVRQYTSLLRAHGDLVERRAQELEQFAHRVAHDLVSPLSALSYCLSAIRRSTGKDPTTADALQRAGACVKRARGMVDGIFEFARAGARPESETEAEVREVLEDVVAEVKTAVDPPLDVRVEPYAPCVVTCDPGVLTSLLSNLMNNAVKYTQDSALRQITVRVIDRGEVIRFEVEDTGPGLAQGLGTNVFEPYVRAPGLTQPGLGLGLATVKRFTEAHGGQVGVRSTPGKGCTFWFDLPRSQQAPVEKSPPAPILTAAAK